MDRRRFLDPQESSSFLAGLLLLSSTALFVATGKDAGIRNSSQGIAVLPFEQIQPKSEAVLFAFDDYFIPFRSNLFVTLRTVEKYPGNPILRRGEAGRPDDARTQFHGTVLRVGGKFRMWYVAWDEESIQAMDRGELFLPRLAYAESDDGIHWTKPSLGLVEYHGSKANNLVEIESGVLWPSIIFEPEEPDPAKRYKMMFKAEGREGILARYSEVKLIMSALCAFSADGLHWRLSQHNPPLKANLEGANFYRFNGGYFVQGQIINRWAPHTGLLLSGDPTGRVLFTYRSPDFVHWIQAPALSFARYGYRSAPAGTVEEAHTANGAWNRENVVISAYSQWHGAEKGESWTDLGLMISNDGIHFREPIPDFKLISRGERESWEGGSLWGASFQNVDNKTYIYYAGLNLGGSNALGRGNIGLATLERDRFGYLSLKIPGDVGTLITCPIHLGKAARIFANVELESGSITFSLIDEKLQPIAGYSQEESQPLTNSGLRQAVGWKRGQVIEGLAERKVMLQVRFTGSGGRSPRLFAVYIDSSR
ncbi:MAG TPA: hypothetical protein VGL91_22880 [Acidobacteriota bacterium]|jgi:hypothetical protein